MRILLVDDDDEDREVFVEAIKERHPNAEFMMASDGEQVIAILENSPRLPDFIFLDINMPLMDGIQCLTLIKSHREFRHLDIVVYSTTNNQKEIATAVRLGARFLLKQADYRKLVRDLDAIVSEKAKASHQSN